MSEVKDTNPKDAVGTGKTPFSTIPSEVVAELGLVMLEGARKYGRHNYRSVGVRASVYFDAAMRHLTRFWEGEDLDPDSGMPHLVHAMACCAVLRDSQVIGNWTDDRPPRLPKDWMVKLNERAAAIVQKYPNAIVAFTERDTACTMPTEAKSNGGSAIEDKYLGSDPEYCEQLSKAHAWVCTQLKGHSGEHIARSVKGRILEMWR